MCQSVFFGVVVKLMCSLASHTASEFDFQHGSILTVLRPVPQSDVSPMVIVTPTL